MRAMNQRTQERRTVLTFASAIYIGALLLLAAYGAAFIALASLL